MIISFHSISFPYELLNGALDLHCNSILKRNISSLFHQSSLPHSDSVSPSPTPCFSQCAVVACLWWILAWQGHGGGAFFFLQSPFSFQSSLFLVQGPTLSLRLPLPVSLSVQWWPVYGGSWRGKVTVVVLFFFSAKSLFLSILTLSRSRLAPELG